MLVKLGLFSLIPGFFLVICQAMLPLNAQEISFNQISTKEGLPGSNIRKLHQDNIGYIWFGVESVGLCKYDGKKYTVYDFEANNPNSLSNNFIWDIVSDGRNLWIATENGLNLYYRDKDKFYRFNNESYNLTDNWSHTLFLDSQNNLWIGTNNGLNCINKKELDNIYSDIYNNRLPLSEKFKHFFHSDSLTEKYGKIRITHIREDSLNQLWISTDAGIFILNRTNGNESPVAHISEHKDGLLNNYVHFTNEYKEGKCIIGTDRGICIYDPIKKTITNYLSKEIQKLKLEYKGYTCYLKDHKGIEWIGMSEGLIVNNKSTNATDRFQYIPEGSNGLCSKTIRDIMEDNTGQIWISTKFGGIHQFRKHQDIFHTYTIDNIINKPNRINDNFILSLLADSKGNIWVGTKYGGLLKYFPSTNTYESYWIDLELENPSNSNRIEYIYEDSQGVIWTANSKGMNKLNQKSKKFTLFPFYQIRSLLEDKNGTFWIGTNRGVYTFNTGNNRFQPYSAPAENSFFSDSGLTVYTMLEDSQSNIWFGTYENGVYVYNKKANNVTHYYNNPNEALTLSGNMIRAIFEDKDGTIWIGTKHNGLNYFLPSSNEFKSLSKKDGLSSNTIYNIQSDGKGNLWIGTHNGLSVFNKNTRKFQNFDEGNGLQSNIFENDAHAKTLDGHLLFGGNNGFNMFNPDEIIIETFISPLSISSIKLDNKDIIFDQNKDTTLYLKHHQNYIDFEFALLDYHRPSKTTYRYMLEGADKNWVDAGTRNYVSYTDLAYGEYTFKLEACGADKSSASFPLNIHLIISPPYWKSNFAKTIYVILALLLITGIYKIATIRANYIHRLHEAKKAIQTNMEINETKLRFFTNVSHELQSPLALIHAPAEKLSKSKNLNEEEAKYVNLIQKNTSRLTRLIEQLMYFRKTQKEVIQLKVMNGDIIGFLTEITQPYVAFAQENNIRFNMLHHEPRIDMWFDPDKIEKIMSNLLMNAFKFTPQQGTVEVTIGSGEYNLVSNNKKNPRKKNLEQIVNISIRDTGKGMNKEELKNIFQRFYMGKNNQEHKGTGIGLELSKTLVELHGGSIRVDSKEGSGSTFTITLFKDRKHFKNSNISEEQIIAGEYRSDIDLSEIISDSCPAPVLQSTDDHKDKNYLVLLVEDNTDLRTFLGENLSEHYNVLLAKNGKEGLETAMKKIPDLIISDVMMPEMNGIDLCHHLKSSTFTSHIPVILLTHKTQIEDKLTGLKTGADDYVCKPFNMQYLLLRINNIFSSIRKVKKQILKELDSGKVESQGISPYDKKLLNRCLEAITQNLSDPEFSVNELGKVVAMSRSQLYRKITALTGQAPAEFIYSNRLAEAKKLLLAGNYSVMDVAHLTGFKSSNSFSTVFKKKFGISPKEFIDQNSSALSHK